MKLYLVSAAERPVWVAALAHEAMYAYVANTGKFHENDALRNDYYMVRNFTYEEIGPAEARRYITEGIGTLNDHDHANALAEWRADTNGLDPTDVLSMAAGHRP